MGKVPRPRRKQPTSQYMVPKTSFLVQNLGLGSLLYFSLFVALLSLDHRGTGHSQCQGARWDAIS